MRSLWIGATSLSVFLAIGACSTGATSPAAPASSATTTVQAAADTDGDYDDAQLTAFIEARREIDPISRNFSSLSAEQQTQATAQIRSIMNRRQMNPVTYDAIQRQIGTDQALAQRVTTLQVATVTDEKLAAFVAASREIQPLTANLASASEAERAQVATQIGAILDRNNIDSNLYNAIALAAQSDPALAARIAAVATPN